MAERPVAIVTGAGSGIGRQVSRLLAGEGWRISLVGRRRERLEETAALVEESGGEALVLPADLAEAAEAAGVIDRTVEAWGRADALVNNAGLAELADIDATDEALLSRTFEINTFAPARLIARLWPVLRRQGGGCVVNVSTRGTGDPFPGFFVYAASKAAVESFTRSIMNERGEAKIRAFSVAPGAVETEILRANFSESAVPRRAAMDAGDVARVIVECILGGRDEQAGGTIYLPSP